MHTIKTILIDDELSSLNVLEKKIRKNCPEINIVQTCSGAAEGIQAIEKLLPQLVFLDIEMPGMSGFTMLQKLVNRNFQLIFVTAYDQYAIKAIKFSALDYLLKPVDVDELKACVARVVESINTHNNQND
jgi:two-component system, LytTR family, response regulator